MSCELLAQCALSFGDAVAAVGLRLEQLLFGLVRGARDGPEVAGVHRARDLLRLVDATALLPVGDGAAHGLPPLMTLNAARFSSGPEIRGAL